MYLAHYIIVGLEKSETFTSFYNGKLGERLSVPSNHHAEFLVIPHDGCIDGKPILYRRRDFYKVSFLDGRYVVHYGDESIETNGTGLIFFDPKTPYTIEPLADSTMGGHLIFKKSYLDSYFRNHIHKLPLFSQDTKPIFHVEQHEIGAVFSLFDKITSEYKSDYIFKDDLIRNYISELFHFALKKKPVLNRYGPIDAKTRLALIFIELLDRQFPIENPLHPFSFRSPRKFADTLGVHVNYLNRAVRTYTGKTTTDYIADRVKEEAIILLKHTSWNIADISYGLGFEDPSHFNHFFKERTQQIPSNFRT